MTGTDARAASARMALARRVSAHIAGLAVRTNRPEAVIALLLAHMDRYHLDRALGFKNLNAFAREGVDWSATKTSRMITLVRQLEGLPVMRREFYAGRIC